MKKSVLLIHGFKSTSESYFLPSLKQQLIKDTVYSPDFPNPNGPDIEDWTAVITGLPTQSFDLVIAHSLGGCFALSLLSRDLIEARSLVLIGTSTSPKDNPHMNTFLRYPINFEHVRAKTKIVTVQSLDDPWTIPECGILNVKQSLGYGLFFADKGHFEAPELPDEVTQLFHTLLS